MAWLVGLGSLLLCALAFASVWGLESEVVEQARAGARQRLEGDLRADVERVVREESDEPGASLESLANRLTLAAQLNPAIREGIVLSPAGAVVARFGRRAQEMPSLSTAPLDRVAERAHAGGAWTGAAIGYRALELAPVFLGLYLLLGALLVAAQRVARRRRTRSALAERVEALGAMAEGINDEIRNPLNAVALSLGFLARRPLEPEAEEVVRAASLQVRRIAETLDELGRRTRVLGLDAREASLRAVVLAAARGGSARPRLEGEVRPRIDVEKLKRALEDVVGLLEARRPAAGEIRITLCERSGEWRLVATGESVDLDDAAVERLFDPYVRTRPRDVGRGLLFARSVFRAHGGDLRAGRRGSRLTLRGHAPMVPPGDPS